MVSQIDRISKMLVTVVFWFTLVFLIFPILAAISMSIDPRGYAAYFPPTGFSLRWFDFFIKYRYYQVGLKNSLILAIITTIVSLAIGIPCSFALVRYNFKGKMIMSSLALSPIIIPGVITGTALVTMMYHHLRFFNAFANLIIGHCIVTIPYVLRTVTASLIGFDRSLEEAAQNLGANQIQTLARITLPIIKPGIIAAAVFVFAVSWGNVAVSAFLTDPFTNTFPIALLGYLRYNFDPSIAAASAFLMGVTLIFVIIIEKTMGIDKFVGIW